MTEFKTTYNLFKSYVESYISDTKSLDFESWMKLPQDLKAAALFVVFYEQITLAYIKLKTDACSEEECVSEVIRYLLKNVSKIENDPKRYRKSYIYTVAYNCIYCVSIDPYRGVTAENSWFNNTCSCWTQTSEGDELCLFDKVECNDAVYEGFKETAISYFQSKGIKVTNTADLDKLFKEEIWDKIFGKLERIDTVTKKRSVKDPKTGICIRDDEGKRIYEDHEVEVEIYSGGMDEDSQEVVRFLIGEVKSLSPAREGKVEDVKKELRIMFADFANLVESISIEISVEDN